MKRDDDCVCIPISANGACPKRAVLLLTILGNDECKLTKTFAHLRAADLRPMEP